LNNSQYDLFQKRVSEQYADHVPLTVIFVGPLCISRQEDVTAIGERLLFVRLRARFYE